MADVGKAIEFVLRLEDSTLSGKVEHGPDDHGGRTRYGIAEASHPGLDSLRFWECAPETALIIAKHIYSDEYARPLHIAEINDEALACAVLSFGIHAGIHTAISTLQHAARVKDDGIIGPITLQAVNTMDSDGLLSMFVSLQRNFYVKLCEENGSQRKFLNGWMQRSLAPMKQANELRKVCV